MNINKYLLVIGILFSSTIAFADVKSNATSEANKLAKAMVAKDYVTVAELTHPAVTKRFGGVDALSAMMKKNYSAAKLTFHKMKFQTPSQLNSSGKMIVAKIPYTSRVQVDKEQYDSSSYYVGFSVNNEKWYFSDCEGMSQDLLKSLAPGYNGKLNLDGC